MPRSGSTWLYNVARLALLAQHGEGQIAAGWIGDRGKLPGAKVQLLKVHDFDSSLADTAWRVLWSYRDLRDVLASLQRKFGTLATLEGSDHFVRQDSHWSPRAAHQMRYESMLLDPLAQVQSVCRALQVDLAHAPAVLRGAMNLDYGSEGPRNEVYNEATLYHRGHVTDGRHGAWNLTLPDSLATAVARRHAGWMAARGYDDAGHPQTAADGHGHPAS